MALKPALTNWFAKLRAATVAAPVDVVWITDSLGALGTNDGPAHPWITTGALNELVGSPPPPVAVFAQAVGGGGTVPIATSSTGTASETGLGGHSSALTNGQIVTHLATCKGFRVTYVNSGTGTLTFRDGPGGTVLGTVTNTNTGELTYWQSGALTAAAHTLHITSTGTTNVGQIIPLNDTRVIGHMATHSGYTSTSFTSAPSKALDLIEKLQATGNLGLVVLATGANDTTYATEMPALLAAIRARTSADVVLWVPYLSNAVPAAEYATTHAAALASGLPLIDSGTYYANFAATWSLDGTHPGYEGQKLLAAQDVAVLSGDPIGQLTRQQALTSAATLVLGDTATTARAGNAHLASRDYITFDDDFVVGDLTLSGSIGEQRWTRTGGTSLAVATGMLGHFGAVRITPATGANNSVLSHAMSLPPAGQASFDVTYWLKCSGTPAGQSHQVGTGQFQNGTYFEHPAGAAYWDCVVQYLGFDLQRVTTTIPVTTDWVKMRIVTYLGSTIMTINDQVVMVVTALSPGPLFARVAQTSVSGAYLDLDRVSLTIWGLSRQATPA